MVDTGDSKSPAERRESSSLSSRSNLREVSDTGVDAIKYINLILKLKLSYYTLDTVQLQMPCRVAEKPDDINRVKKSKQTVITLKPIYARCMCVNVIGFLAYPMSRMKS